MARSFPELPDWSFDADEVSQGVYRAFGRDRAGRNVEAFGLDPEMLIEKCRQAALEIMAESRKLSNSSRS
jgi:hypothetical protein